MGRLLDESIEAEEFIATELERLSGSRSGSLYFRAGVAASTGPDRTGHSLTVQYLRERAEQISKYGEWVVLGHDPLNPPIGRMVAARVFFAPQSGKHFLVTILELYPPERRLTFELVGVTDFEPVPGIRFEFLVPQIPGQEHRTVSVGYDPYEIDSALIKEILAESPPIVDRIPLREFRKGAAEDLLSILNLSVPLFALMPAYLAVLMTTLRDELAKRAIAGAVESSALFFSWLVEKVVGRVSKSKLKRAQIVINTEYKECALQFIVDSTDAAVLTDAAKSVEQSIPSALSLHRRLEFRGPEKIVYEYDKKLKRWLPLYVTTFGGEVVSNRPYLVVLDQLPQHLSIAGCEVPSAELAEAGESANAAGNGVLGD